MNGKVLAMLVASSAGGLFLLVDQFLKYGARMNQYTKVYLIDSWLGWEYFQNFGIAFGLPLSSFVVLPVSFLIIGGLILYAGHEKQRPWSLLFGVSFVVWGALSNIIDRMFFGYTIDYIRIYRSVINVADISIVMGAFLLILAEYKKKNQKECG